MEKSQGTGIESTAAKTAWLQFMEKPSDAWKNPKERELKANMLPGNE